MGSNLIGGGTGLERERLQGTQTGLDADRVLEEKEITGFSNTIIGYLIWEMGFGGR